MILTDFTDTICVISSPQGNGAVALVRVTGAKAIELCQSVFYSSKPKQLKDLASHTLHYGKIKDGEQLIDEVVLGIYRSPNSYTGEDIVEISCHGSRYIQQQILQLLIRQGARMANPGEFTQRAFMNGKLDLSQAEAVNDLIVAESKSAHRLAMQQMRGTYSNEMKDLRQQLLDFTSLIELELDFGEEDVHFADRSQLLKLVETIQARIIKLIESFSTGNAIKNGVPIAIVGEPNVGKSTLLNVLLNEEKAIVSEIAGTTRDSIEDTLIIDGILFRFIDTAGLRETTDTIEKIGIERTYLAIEKASIILYLFDASNTDIERADAIIDELKKDELFRSKHYLKVFNKADVMPHATNKEIAKTTDVIYISAKQKNKIEELKQFLVKASNIQSFDDNQVVVTNVRHYEVLTKTLTFINLVSDGLKSELSSDLLTIDIRSALHYLGEITGHISTDEVLGNIFSRFCIGK